MADAGNGITRCEYCGSSCGCGIDCPAPHNILISDSDKLESMYCLYRKRISTIDSLECQLMESRIEEEYLRQERDVLLKKLSYQDQQTQDLAIQAGDNMRRAVAAEKVLERADALADAIQHAADLREVADFLRERIEELRQSVEEPWRMQFDEFKAAVKEMANRRIAFDELYECTEYTSLVDMIEESAKAYQEARNG